MDPGDISMKKMDKSSCSHGDDMLRGREKKPKNPKNQPEQTLGETGLSVYGNSMYCLHSFINLKLKLKTTTTTTNIYIYLSI